MSFPVIAINCGSEAASQFGQTITQNVLFKTTIASRLALGNAIHDRVSTGKKNGAPTKRTEKP